MLYDNILNMKHITEAKILIDWYYKFSGSPWKE